MTAPRTRSAAPPEALVERFRQELDRLWPEGGKLGLAVSGGPDSLAMLLLAEASIPGLFEVATVDHGLRPEAAAECAMVARVCAARDIACQILKVAPAAGNLQAKARAARYEALSGWASERQLGAVATAHHADDQAETLVMRLNRGCGLAGLAGVREVGCLFDDDERIVLRPLLTFRRFELQAIVDHAGLQAVQDPSNEDLSFERARVRRELTSAEWLEPRAWAQSAAHLAEVEETLDFLAHQVWSENAVPMNGGIRLKYHGWRAVQRRLLERGIRELGGSPRGGDLDRLFNRLRRDAGGNVAGVLVTTEYSREKGYFWIFRPEPPRRTS